jgi:hypothetical protein
MTSIIISICIVSFAVVALLWTLYMSKGMVYMYKEHFHPQLHLAGPSKCFSCEASLPPHLKWQGRQTKCFDCEKQLAAVDPNLANLTHGTKCFSCEKESRPPQIPMRHSTPADGTGFMHADPQGCMDAGSGNCMFA